MSGLLASLLGNRASREKLRGLLGNVSDFAGNPVGYTQGALNNALPSIEELSTHGMQMQTTGEVSAEFDPRIMDLGMGLLGPTKIRAQIASPREPTVSVMQKAIKLVGEDEFRKSVSYRLKELDNPDLGPLSPEETAAEIEGVARMILEYFGK